MNFSDGLSARTGAVVEVTGGVLTAYNNGNGVVAYDGAMITSASYGIDTAYNGASGIYATGFGYVYAPFAASYDNGAFGYRTFTGGYIRAENSSPRTSLQRFGGRGVDRGRDRPDPALSDDERWTGRGSPRPVQQPSRGTPVGGGIIAPMFRAAATVLALALLGCPPPDPDPEPPTFDYPLDDVLRINHLQGIGTHNSYHLAPASDGIAEWNYSHAPLGEQLGELGVRQFELDVWWDSGRGEFEVVHVPLLDDNSSCALLVDCLDALRTWSDSHPAHHPIFVLVEPKDSFDENTAGAFFDDLDDSILAAWPRERILTPGEVQGGHPSLREAIALDGWPTLGEGRGKIVLQLHDGGSPRGPYYLGDAPYTDHLMFVDTSADSPVAGWIAMNDPIGAGGDAIRAAVDAGLIVRTRADASPDDFVGGDTTRLQGGHRQRRPLPVDRPPVPR